MSQGQTAPARGPCDGDAALGRQVLAEIARGSDFSLVNAGCTSSRTIVRFAQRHRELPVIGAGASVALQNGRVVARVSVELDLGSAEPTLDVEQAAHDATAETGFELATRGATLAFLPTPAGPARLVYVLVGTRGLSRRVALVDAHDGGVLLLYDPVKRFGLARVYPENPIDTPALVDVSLDLPAGSTSLENARVRALTCVDLHDVRQTLYGNLHVCHLEPKAQADANGDFLLTPAQPTEPEDPFAELSVFYHADTGLQRFAALGAPGLGSTRLNVVANLMWPPGTLEGDSALGGNADAPFEPLAGSFYGDDPLFGGVNGLSGPTLWFGQGPATDYGYDGDVVFHELTHAVLDASLPRVSWQHADAQGLVGSPGAINEAVADYFAAVFTDDPQIGEFAAPNLAPGLEAYRNVANSARCPDDLSGEAHFDSATLSGALWSVRSSLPATDHQAFDQTVLDAALAVPSGDLGFDDFSTVLLDVVGAATIGSSAKSELYRELDQRGLLACERVLGYAGTPIDSGDTLRSDSAFIAPGRFDTPWTANGRPPLLDYAPGILQFRADLGEAPVLGVRFEAFAGGSKKDDGVAPSAQAPSPLVLVSWDSPIRFDWSNGGSVDLDEATSSTPRGDSYSVNFGVQSGATRAFVMIANAGDFAFRYKHIEIEQGAASNAAGGDGCACSVASAEHRGHASASALALLGLAMLWRTRRRVARA